MLKKKNLVALSVLFASCLASSCYAVSDTASQPVQGVLEAFIDIQPETAGAITSVNISPDDGSLSQSLISKFRVRTNSTAPKVYLQANTENNSNLKENALFKSGSTNYIVLSNINNKPTSASITNCKDILPQTSLNADSIAYPISSIVLDNSGTSEYDEAKEQYNVNVEQGQTYLTTTIGTVPLANTYSYEDTAGTYQATLVLSTTTL